MLPLSSWPVCTCNSNFDLFEDDKHLSQCPRIAVIYAPPSNFGYGTSNPRGPLAVKIRHLKILGYTPVLVRANSNWLSWVLLVFLNVKTSEILLLNQLSRLTFKAEHLSVPSAQQRFLLLMFSVIYYNMTHTVYFHISFKYFTYGIEV